jgi:hypothetical protein
VSNGARRLMLAWVAMTASLVATRPGSAQSGFALQRHDARLTVPVTPVRFARAEADTAALLRTQMVARSARIGGAIGAVVGAIAGVATLLSHVPLSEMDGCMSWDECEEYCEMPTVIGLPLLTAGVGGLVGHLVGSGVGGAIGMTIPVRLGSGRRP